MSKKMNIRSGNEVNANDERERPVVHYTDNGVAYVDIGELLRSAAGQRQLKLARRSSLAEQVRKRRLQKAAE